MVVLYASQVGMPSKIALPNIWKGRIMYYCDATQSVSRLNWRNRRPYYERESVMSILNDDEMDSMKFTQR